MPIAWLVNSWVVLFGLIPLLLVLFPNGHLLSARWRPVVWLTPPTMILGFFTVGLDLGPMTTQVPLLEAAFGPETGGWLVQAGRNLQGCAMLAAFVARASCLGLRLYRARGDERAQLKWFGYASMVLACTFVVLHLIFASPLRELSTPRTQCGRSSPVYREHLARHKQPRL